MRAHFFLSALGRWRFLYERPGARRFLHVDTKNVEDVLTLGVRRRVPLGGAGAIIGLVILHTGDEVVGRTVILVAYWYMLLASIAMVLADLLGHWRPRGGSVMGTVGSSVLRWSPSWPAV